MTQIRLIGFASPETLEHAIRDHSIILERVKARDPAGACLAMTEHITHSYEILGSVLESKMRLKNVEK